MKPSMHFRKDNTELSVDFRKDNTEPKKKKLFWLVLFFEEHNIRPVVFLSHCFIVKEGFPTSDTHTQQQEQKKKGNTLKKGPTENAILQVFLC